MGRWEIKLDSTRMDRPVHKVKSTDRYFRMKEKKWFFRRELQPAAVIRIQTKDVFHLPRTMVCTYLSKHLKSVSRRITPKFLASLEKLAHTAPSFHSGSLGRRLLESFSPRQSLSSWILHVAIHPFTLPPTFFTYMICQALQVLGFAAPIHTPRILLKADTKLLADPTLAIYCHFR